MIESKVSNTRDIPIWLTALVILMCIGGGTWLIKWYMKEQPRQVAEVPEDKLQGNNNGNGRGFRGALGNGGGGGGNQNYTPRQPQRDPNADGIQPWGRSSFRAKSGNTVMTINYSGNSGRFDISPQYLTIRTPEEAKLAVLRMSILQDPSWREFLNVTDAQLAKLRSVPAPQSMTLAADDKARLSELWKAYHDGAAAVKVAKEKELLAALDEVGKKNLGPTKEYEASRAEMVRTALTPEQIKLYDEGKPPAPKPVPEPVKPAATKLKATPELKTPEFKSPDVKAPDSKLIEGKTDLSTSIDVSNSGRLDKSIAPVRPTTRPAAAPGSVEPTK